MIIEILKPQLRSPSYPVVLETPDTGYICAEVSVTDDPDDPLDPSVTLTMVRAMIVSDPSPGLPASPASAGAEGVPDPTIANQWNFHVLDGPPMALSDHSVHGAAASAGGEENYLAVWLIFSSGPPEGPLTRRFLGTPAGQTACEAITVPEPGPHHRGIAALAGCKQILLPPCPQRWVISPSGFANVGSIDATVFNGVTNLDFVQDMGKKYMWDNQIHDDTDPPNEEPIIKLLCEAPYPATFQLWFINHGVPSLLYTKAAKDWKSFHTNIMTLSVPHPKPAWAPDSIRISPVT